MRLQLTIPLLIISFGWSTMVTLLMENKVLRSAQKLCQDKNFWSQLHEPITSPALLPCDFYFIGVRQKNKIINQSPKHFKTCKFKLNRCLNAYQHMNLWGNPRKMSRRGCTNVLKIQKIVLKLNSLVWSLCNFTALQLCFILFVFKTEWIFNHPVRSFQLSLLYDQSKVLTSLSTDSLE